MALVPEISVCVICMRKVLDTEKGIQCDKKCDRWFHVSCVELTDTEYAELSSNTKKKWFCNRVDCVSLNNHPTNTLNSKIDEFSEKMDNMLDWMKKLANIPSDIASIKKELKEVNQTLASLEPRLSGAEQRIDSLERDIKSLKSTDQESVSCDLVLEEIAQRNRCACNVIAYGVNESSSSNSTLRVNHDSSLITLMVDAFCPNQNKTPEFKSFRIGRSSERGPRPLKIIFKAQSDVAYFMSNYNIDTLHGLDQSLANASISRDRTKNERKRLDELRQQLKTRTDSGETGLTIKYQNGIPKIVNVKKN